MEKTKPNLRFPNFKENWNKKKLKDIAEVNPTNTELPQTFIYIDLESVETGVLKKENLISKENAPSRAQRLLKENDILFQTVRPYQMNNLFFNKTGNYVASTGYAQIRACQNSKFLYQYLHFKKFVDLVLEKCTGTSYPSINATDLTKTIISIPSLPEQQKIASFLSTVDEKINLLKKQLTLLEQYKKGVMQKIFSREIRFKDEDGKEFPEWEFLNGDKVFNSISNKNQNSDLPVLAISQEFGAIPRHLIDYKVAVTDKSLESYKVVEVGDFIISLRSFQGGIEYSTYKGICSPAYVILKPIIEIERFFYKCYFKTDNYIIELNKKLEGIRDGKMVSFKYFSEIQIPFPCISEQQKIASFLSSIEDKLEKNKNQIRKMELWKKGLLQQMFV